ncbi:MAG TPA: hypothetical protein P5234_02885 [Thermoanaerobaculaceae bacterium]|nr:hypothetical protein [Thermoanaerobaculaceae bacterium]HRS15174.1 hypothetical protein [Thermoanaerobaculaceae bacterium]
MQRIEPAFPDLLPVSHRLGGPPVAASAPSLDPVDMRLRWPGSPPTPVPADRSVPRRPCTFLLHAGTARADGERLARLLEAGSGAVLVLDEPLTPDELPAAGAASQVVALVPWFPELYGERRVPDLGAWKAGGFATGVLLGLAPCPQPQRRVEAAVAEAARAGAGFVLAAPVCLPAEERHRAYDRHSGEEGDGELENLLFHSDLGHLMLELERAASRAAARLGLEEGLPGPATALVAAETVWAACRLLLWAHRLDALDAMGSPGWQLRRAARALLASRQRPKTLMEEDNLRVVPGFNPWVEAFARGVWGGGGSPFDEARSRWLCNE